MVPKEKNASNLAEIMLLDLTTCKVEDFAEFYSDFEFEVNCDCEITDICVCFYTRFGKGDFHEFVHKPLEPANSLETNQAQETNT